MRWLEGVRTLRPGLILGLRDGRDPADTAALCRLSFRGVEGVVVGVPMLPDQLLADQHAAVAAMADVLTERVGADFVGLGGMLAVVGGRGVALSERCGLPVTTGNAATAWAALRITSQVARPGPIAVLGGRAAVGKALHRLLLDEGFEAVLDPEDLSVYRTVVGAQATGGQVDPARLGPGAALVDVALPRTLSGAARPDMVVVKGESVALPPGWGRDLWGHVFHVLAGYGHSSVYACLLEPLVAVLEGRTEPYALGRHLDPEAVRAFGRSAEALGFVPEVKYLSRAR